MKISNGKVIVAHPGQQHSYRLASALKHAGLLDEYATTLYYRSPMSLLGLMAAVAPGDNGDRIRNRCNPDLDPSDVKQFYELRGIAETLMWRTRNVRRYSSYMNRTKELFGVAVAKDAIERGASAVVCYDTNAAPTFRYLEQHAPNIRRVLDASNVPRAFRRFFYDKIIAETGDTRLRLEEPFAWDSFDDERDAEEISLADYCLAASDFVVEGLAFCGADRDRILKLPYGSNFGVSPKRGIESVSGKFELLFVGQCRVRKGLQGLADALDDELLGPCRVTIAGKYDNNAPYMIRLLENPKAQVLGMVSHDEISKLCAQSNAFVFPSYNEGMSLSCLEALGSGLPLITTPNSGVADIVASNKAGVVVPCADATALVDAMNRYIDNPSACFEDGNRAIDAARGYTWGAYEKRAACLFEEVVLA